MGDASGSRVPILDIRSTEAVASLADVVRKSLNPPLGEPKSFPTLLLYDGTSDLVEEDYH